MSIINRFNTELGKSFDDYVNTYLGPKGVAFTSPNKTAYDIAVNEAAAKVPSQALEGTFPGMTGKVLGTLSDFTMPALALGSSPFYDMYQASERARAKYGEPDVLGITGDSEIPMGPSFPEYAKAVADENIISSAIGRTAGAGKNLANRFSRIKDGIVANIPESIFTSAYAPEISEKDRRSIDITDKVDDYYEKGEMMDNVVDAPEDGILQTLLSKGKDIVGNVFDKIPNVGIMGMLSKLDNFKNLSPLDRQFILQQAGGNRPNKDKYGYNIRSAFGNYANLVGRKALNAATKTRFGIPLTAMDLYYQNKEKERAAKDRAVLDEYFGGSGDTVGPKGPTGGRYDGASSAEEYASDPGKGSTFSGSS